MMWTADFAELVLVVQDVEMAARFYREVIGLTPDDTFPADLAGKPRVWAWFWTGPPGASARIAVRHGPLLFEEHSPFPVGQRWGAVHFALRLPRSRWETMRDHLQTVGVTVYGPVRLGWMAADSLYVYDPDGNLVELWSPDEPV